MIKSTVNIFRLAVLEKAQLGYKKLIKSEASLLLVFSFELWLMFLVFFHYCGVNAVIVTGMSVLEV